MAKLTLNTEDARNTLSNMQDISNGYSPLITELSNFRDTMELNGWKGNTSTTFYQNIDQYQANFKSLVEQLENIIAQLTTATSQGEQLSEETANGA